MKLLLILWAAIWFLVYNFIRNTIWWGSQDSIDHLIFNTIAKLIIGSFPLVICVFKRERQMTYGLSAHNALGSLLEGVVSGLCFAIMFVLISSIVHETSFFKTLSRFGIPFAKYGNFYIFYVAANIANAYAEEMLTRGMLIGELLVKVRPMTAILFSSFAFGLPHFGHLFFEPISYAVFFGVIALLFGAYWAWLFVRRNNIIGPIVSHFIADMSLCFLVTGY